MLPLINRYSLQLLLGLAALPWRIGSVVAGFWSSESGATAFIVTGTTVIDSSRNALTTRFV